MTLRWNHMLNAWIRHLIWPCTIVGSLSQKQCDRQRFNKQYTNYIFHAFLCLYMQEFALTTYIQNMQLEEMRFISTLPVFPQHSCIIFNDNWTTNPTLPSSSSAASQVAPGTSRFWVSMVTKSFRYQKCRYWTLQGYFEGGFSLT